MISSQPQNKYQIAMKATSQHLKFEVHKQITMDHTTIKFTNHNSNHGPGHVFLITAHLPWFFACAYSGKIMRYDAILE
jgi:hypothetical protein